MSSPHTALKSLAITPKLIQYHQPQGNTNDCAPFTVAMIINALRDTPALDGAAVARSMNTPRLAFTPLPLLIIRRIPNWATFPWGIVDELNRHGIRARWKFGGREDDLRRALAEERIPVPILGEIWNPQFSRWPWAHVKILAARDDERGYGFVDPASPRAEMVWQPPFLFERLWKTFGRLLVETL